MIIRIVVDLPEPFGPRNPVTTPGRTVKLNWSTASLVPYRLDKPDAAIIGGLGRLDLQAFVLRFGVGVSFAYGTTTLQR
jgi:hypothetical protein